MQSNDRATPAGAESGFGVAPPEFRLPTSTRPGVVTFMVSDLEQSLRFYRDILGFTAVETGSGRVSLRGAGDGSEEVIILVQGEGLTPVPPQGQLGLFHVAILLPNRADLAELVTSLANSGVQFGASDHSVSEAIYLSDPDGMGIEIYIDRPSHAWVQQGEELYMTTEPLNLRQLIGSAGEQGWQGMPNGTRVGHVHLRVADLEQANQFYHHGLGLDRIVWTYPGALFLSAGGYHHHLGLNTWSRHAQVAGDNEARLLEWSLLLPDQASVDQAAESLQQHGYTVEREGSTLRAADPWDTVVALATAK